MDKSRLVDGNNEHAESLRLNHMCSEMSKLTCMSAPYNDTYIVCMDMVNEASRQVGTTINSLMSYRATVEAAAEAGVGGNALASAWAASGEVKGKMHGLMLGLLLVT
ncbi:hypothetical protein Dimus_010173, partial [Dionaea muscipula]